MNRLLLPIIIVFSFAGTFFLAGCAGFSVMQLQDASTLGEGNSTLGFSTSAGLNAGELLTDSTIANNYNSTE